MLDTPFRSATQLAAAIRRKKIGCLELLAARTAEDPAATWVADETSSIRDA